MARCLPYLRVDCEGFEVETLVNVRIAKGGLVIHEVPSCERQRIHCHTLNAVRDGMRRAPHHRAGAHAISHEPSAIVWHEHPDGSSRLRSQVFRYGVGLGAALAKQLLAGPGRLELLRSVPAGVRYLKEPLSRKNAGKAADYPRRLNWLERLGMLLGPAAYVTSAARRRIRRLTLGVRGARANAPAIHVERVALSSGRSVEVVSFPDLELVPRPSEEDRPAARRDRAGP